MDQDVRFGEGFRFDVATARLWSGEREVRLTACLHAPHGRQGQQGHRHDPVERAATVGPDAKRGGGPGGDSHTNVPKETNTWTVPSPRSNQASDGRAFNAATSSTSGSEP